MQLLAKLWMLVVCASLMGLGGCRSGDSPPLGRVEGTVTLDGKPLSEGRIMFVPVDGGRTSTGEFDESGNYQLIYSLDEWGAKVGEHTVKITTQNDFGGGERIPAKYNVDSELKAVVEGGSNTFDFELTGEMRKNPRS